MNLLRWFWLIASVLAVLMALYSMTVVTGLADRIGEDDLGKDDKFRVGFAIFGLLYVAAFAVLVAYAML